MGQDIPLEDVDRYWIEDDGDIARRIVELENQYSSDPDDGIAAMELGRLYTITSLGKRGFKMLKKAKQLDPRNPEPYKYLAILNVDMFYQYEKAIPELEEYVSLRPDDVFGRNYLAYLYYETKQYKKAAEQWEKVQELDPQNGYAACKRVRAYARIHDGAPKLDPRRLHYRNRTLAAYREAVSILSEDHRRIKWLKRWLDRKTTVTQ
jgi:tetratricopeptide (TPR) repeat protein